MTDNLEYQYQDAGLNHSHDDLLAPVMRLVRGINPKKYSTWVAGMVAWLTSFQALQR